jgi:hypothetical protein
VYGRRRHAIHARGGFALKRVDRSPERVGIDVVEERGELSLLLVWGLPTFGRPGRKKGMVDLIPDLPLPNNSNPHFVQRFLPYLSGAHTFSSKQ